MLSIKYSLTEPHPDGRSNMKGPDSAKRSLALLFFDQKKRAMPRFF
ncbi:hypothetical protein PsAD2_03799 [Pseudovibrio axinellae]|uniref:Uncharacterized protein n=1 Tax=Pseudovibrio axinellae TaxID=989403 RepID=A0A165UL33_9HYPH|nr:hypothetical protein PsAD2_03799 [Pseudovibrio axinellae]SEP69803.1 hypothetical protein SAMN05421798_101181 [Pseudovibrio axinellae]